MLKDETPRFCLNPKCKRLLKPYIQKVWDGGRETGHPAWYCEGCCTTYYSWEFDCPKAHKKVAQVHATL